MFTSVLSYAQDVQLNHQTHVDNFYPGTSYTGNITIGRVGQGGSVSNITSLFNLSVLRELNGNLIISKNELLEHLDDLSQLKIINGSLEILSNEKLEDIDGLSALDTVMQNIKIINNMALKDIDGLSDNLSYVSNILRIQNNNLIDKIDNFSKLLNDHSFDLIISNNDNLKTISGFDNLTRIGGIHVGSNLILEHIKGFSNLTEIDINCNLSANNSLSNIDALSTVTVMGALQINYNNSLPNLDGLFNLNHIQASLSISNNESLEDCCGIRELLVDPVGIGGLTIINNNPSECSSEIEIVDKYCGLRFNHYIHPACIGQDNGALQIDVTNYNAIPFHYDWLRHEDGMTGSGLSYDDKFNIETLQAGTYDLTLHTPALDTSTHYDIYLPELDGSVFEIIQVESTNSTNELSNGSIQIIVTGSPPPYDVSWSGPVSGSQSGILSDTIIISLIPSGEYSITIRDSDGEIREVMLTLLDETVPTFPCSQPLDIVILNDVSGSVDQTEYQESKEFFVNFLQAANIGLEDDESLAAIVEWSNADQQEIKIPLTGDINMLNEYTNAQRSFSDGTIIHDAMVFGGDYLNNEGRSEAENVLIIATDGSQGQVPGSLIALADQFKAKGFHILTIAFDGAYSDIVTRDVLFKMASVGALAPGAPAYSELDEDLAENIVFTYLCPIDPGETSNVYFNRDGSIDITEITPIPDCINPEFVDLTFTIEAFRELSIPGGTHVSFYLNDPEQFGASNLLTWQLPCSIAPDSSESYTVTLPISGPSHIFAVLNDDGSQGSPISFPITDIEELAYSNNIDDEWVCVGNFPTVQALKYTTTPTPSCDTIVNYTINVCNISEVDAVGVVVTDQAPDGFVLVNEVVNLNDCATANNGSFDIQADCCFTISLSYDASGAALGYYGDQDVILSGPADQEYYGYDGASSTAEDVILDGTIDCPSTIIEFFKEVNFTESCDDAFLTFTFTINNELTYPLQGLVFTDIVPQPSSWVFEPYNITGLSIGTKFINQNFAQFIIDQVDADTVASFSFDVSLGFWEEAGTLINSAELENVPDLENGGTKTLTSNTTTTVITPTSPPDLPDTIVVNIEGDTLFFDFPLDTSGTASWTSLGDGTFLAFENPTLSYVLGTQDQLDEYVIFNLMFETDCFQMEEEVVVILQECELSIDDFTINECDDNDTPANFSDDTFTLDFNISAQHPGINSRFYFILENDTLGNYSYGTGHTITLPADGVERIITFVDDQFENCLLTDTINVANCSDPCALDLLQLSITDCDDNDTPDDTSDDIFSINFNIGAEYPGLDSMYQVIIGNDTIEGFHYFENQKITITASNNFDAVQFIDSQNENCFLSLNVGVENCIYPCEMQVEQFEVSECEDAGTIDDGSDDTFTVTFNVSGAYQGTDSTYYLIINMDTIGMYSYGTEETITLPADGMDYGIGFLDTEFLDCLWSDTLNVQSCSIPCELEIAQLVENGCNDNGTPSDDSDDFFTINFTITSIAPGLDSTYFVIVEDDTLGIFSYELEQELSLPADGEDHNILFVDSQIEDCLLTTTVGTESCSDACQLEITQFTISECDNNGSPVDNSDDTYEITFEVSAINAGPDMTFFALMGMDTLGEFAYDIEHTITIQAEGSGITMTFEDSQHSECTISEVFDIESCSFQCELSIASFAVSECEDNGTPDDSSDDIFELSFEVLAQNPSMDSVFILIIGTNVIGQFSYNNLHSITLPALDDDYLITIHDSQNTDCLITEMVRVESCTNTCELTLMNFDISGCDDNGTAHEIADDSYTITFNISATYPYQDSIYHVLLDDEFLGSFSYDSDNSLIILANGEEGSIQFVDSKFEYCIHTEVIDLEHCSTLNIISEDINIPNIFSPNDDGINDDWVVVPSINNEVIRCRIYDRWGNLIYINEPGQAPSWDGRFNEKPVNSGVYIYQILYSNSVNETKVIYGDITVIY